MQEHKYD